MLLDQEATLVEQARDGSRDAFSNLVLAHQDRLFRSVYAMAPTHADAEDIVQEAFVRAFIKLGTFKGESCFYTWLFRIARNVTLSRRRRKRPTKSLEWEMQESTWQPTDNRASATDKLEREEDIHQLRKAMRQLPETYRTILQLREIEGFDYATIADLLQLKVGTVRSRLHRARVELAETVNAGTSHEHG